MEMICEQKPLIGRGSETDEEQGSRRAGYLTYSVPIKEDIDNNNSDDEEKSTSSIASSLKTDSSFPNSILAINDDNDGHNYVDEDDDDDHHQQKKKQDKRRHAKRRKNNQQSSAGGSSTKQDRFFPFNSTTITTTTTAISRIFRHIDPMAFQFAFRMAICLTVSALFVLIRTPDFTYPDGMWVLVSVLFVCWFPALDAASVIEKIIQRLIGTFVGAALGLSCGFLSLWFFQTRTAQATFLGVCTFLGNFCIIFFAGQCKVGQLKVIKRYAYATILCVLTFCICMLPFAGDAAVKWERGVMRVLNVIVGCFLGACGSIVVCPKSTTKVLFDKTARQVKMAGEAAEAVLIMSSDFFSGRILVNRLADELLNTPLESELRWKLRRSDTSISLGSNGGSFANCSASIASSSSSSRSSSTASLTTAYNINLNSDNHMGGATDVALKKYEDAISEWRLSKSLFPLSKYDPFQNMTILNKNKTTQEKSTQAREFQTEVARTLARALRIQTTIVVLDGMVRSDADYMFTPNQLDSFRVVGMSIKMMLHVPLNLQKSDDAAKVLFTELDCVRTEIRNMSMAMAASREEGDDEYFDLEREEGLKDFQNSLFNKSGSNAEQQSMRTVDDDLGRGIPTNVTGSQDNTLFFLQLVEHLILRSLRLYQAWKHAEPTGRNLDN